MNEWLSAALPLIALVLFLSAIYWPEVRPGLQRLRFATGHVLPRSVTPSTTARPRPAVVPVRRRARRSFQTKRPATPRTHVQPIEQPRTTSHDVALEAQRIEIAKRLHAAGISETVVIECVWSVRRGGGKSFLAARETFRAQVANSTETESAIAA